MNINFNSINQIQPTGFDYQAYKRPSNVDYDVLKDKWLYKRIHDRKIKPLSSQITSKLFHPKQIYCKIKNALTYIINIKSILRLRGITNQLILQYQQDGKFEKDQILTLNNMLRGLSPKIVNISGLFDIDSVEFRVSLNSLIINTNMVNVIKNLFKYRT